MEALMPSDAERIKQVATELMAAVLDDGDRPEDLLVEYFRVLNAFAAEVRRSALEEAIAIGKQFEIADEVSSRIRALIDKERK